MMAPHTNSHANFAALLWHAVFLALATNFLDVDTIIPAMFIKAGGTEIHLGFMTAIMLGGTKFSQVAFAGFLSHWPRKKKFLLWGINLRVGALYVLALSFFYAEQCCRWYLDHRPQLDRGIVWRVCPF